MAALAAVVGLLVIAPAAMAALENENLLTPLPRGFKIGSHSQQGRMVMAEYVPTAETVDNWSRLITVQTFHGLSAVDPDGVPANMARGWEGACSSGTAIKVTAAVENGYRVSIWQFLCPINPATHRPENMWLKSISGHDSLYIVQYAYRRILTNDLIGPAMGYLRKIMVCDTRRPDRPCPKGM